MSLLNELKETLKGENWKDKYEQLGTQYNDLVDQDEKRKKRLRELIYMLNIYEEELLKYKSESDYQAFLELVAFEHKIRLPKKQLERLEQKKGPEKKKFSMEELKQRAIQKREQKQEQKQELKIIKQPDKE